MGRLILIASLFLSSSGFALSIGGESGHGEAGVGHIIAILVAHGVSEELISECINPIGLWEVKCLEELLPPDFFGKR